MHKRKAQLRIKLDFYSDWIQLLSAHLAAAGYPPASNEGARAISLRYFSLKRRLLTARPRTLFDSKQFTCPPQHQVGLDAIKAKAQRGDPLWPHMSTRLADPDYNDLLLNDWGIHHFHLSTSAHPRVPGFLARTGPVLFARATDSAFYLVDVMSHGDWARRRVVEIIRNNWPDLIAPCKLAGIASASPHTDDHHRNMRKAHAMTLLHFDDGSSYVPFGGGLTSSGHCVDAVDEMDKCTSWIRELEGRARSNAARHVQEARAKGYQIGPHLHFKLRLDSKDRPMAYEKYSKLLFALE